MVVEERGRLFLAATLLPLANVSSRASKTPQFKLLKVPQLFFIIKCKSRACIFKSLWCFHEVFKRKKSFLNVSPLILIILLSRVLVSSL